MGNAAEAGCGGAMAAMTGMGGGGGCDGGDWGVGGCGGFGKTGAVRGDDGELGYLVSEASGAGPQGAFADARHEADDAYACEHGGFGVDDDDPYNNIYDNYTFDPEDGE